jgi:hypothetical protein
VISDITYHHTSKSVTVWLSHQRHILCDVSTSTTCVILLLLGSVTHYVYPRKRRPLSPPWTPNTIKSGQRRNLRHSFLITSLWAMTSTATTSRPSKWSKKSRNKSPPVSTWVCRRECRRMLRWRLIFSC